MMKTLYQAIDALRCRRRVVTCTEAEAEYAVEHLHPTHVEQVKRNLGQCSVASFGDVTQWESMPGYTCPLLIDGVCSVERHRPIECRTGDHNQTAVSVILQEQPDTRCGSLPAMLTKVITCD